VKQMKASIPREWTVGYDLVYGHDLIAGTSNLGRRRLSIYREFCTLELHSPVCF
jgi:hypothetical protein